MKVNNDKIHLPALQLCKNKKAVANINLESPKDVRHTFLDIGLLRVLL